MVECQEDQGVEEVTPAKPSQTPPGAERIAPEGSGLGDLGGKDEVGPEVVVRAESSGGSGSEEPQPSGPREHERCPAGPVRLERGPKPPGPGSVPGLARRHQRRGPAGQQERRDDSRADPAEPFEKPAEEDPQSESQGGAVGDGRGAAAAFEQAPAACAGHEKGGSPTERYDRVHRLASARPW
jgi:hypothetical protein